MLDRFLGGYVTASPTLPTQSSAQGVWELEQQASAQVQNAWPLPPNVIQRSLRFNSADSTYLNRTPAVASTTGRKVWTWSGWIKRSGLGSSRFCVFGASASTNQAYILFEGDQLDFLEYQAAVLGRKKTTAVFRDPSAYYHVVCIFDTTNGTPGDRMQVWINGVRQTAFAISTDPSLNLDGTVNSVVPHAVGREELSDTDYFSGYMAEVNFVDGQALTPSSFGETDAQTGVWVPKRYTGTYGTNGFRLPFTNNSTTTALGYDASGNGNNWTPNNFSVTAGSGNDSLLDVPSLYGTDTGLGGEVRGNYCTLNPLALPPSSTMSNGNLDITTSSGWYSYVGTIAVSTGKWYFEYGLASGLYTYIGVRNNIDLSGNPPFATSSSGGVYYNNGQKNSSAGLQTYAASWTIGDVIGVAFDADAGTLTFYKNGVSQGQAFSGLTSGPYYPNVQLYQSGGTINFGQRPFAYTAPSGFKALCTTNLSASGTVTSSGTFTGNASTDGPFVYLNGVPVAMTINGNAVTFGTQADKLSNGFKVRSSSSSYNTSGSNTYSITTNTGPIFRYSNAQGNP